MKLQDEQKQRNIDPFELQVFQEQVSANLFEIEDQIRKSTESKEWDQLSKAPSNVYKGFEKKKKLAKKQRDTNSLPKHVRENIKEI